MSFEILFPFGLWVSEPGWLLNHSQLGPNISPFGPMDTAPDFGSEDSGFESQAGLKKPPRTFFATHLLGSSFL